LFLINLAALSLEKWREKNFITDSDATGIIKKEA